MFDERPIWQQKKFLAFCAFCTLFTTCLIVTVCLPNALDPQVLVNLSIGLVAVTSIYHVAQTVHDKAAVESVRKVDP